MVTFITGRRLGRGEIVRGIVAKNVKLDDCWTEQGPADSQRPRFEDLQITGLSLRRSSLTGAVLRNVTIDGLRSDSFSVFFQANEYERVTFRGRIPSLVLGARRSGPEWSESYETALRAADERADWSIDISEAIGAVEVRGYSADRLRLNPERQGVVRRGTLVERGWNDADVVASGFPITIRLMLDGGWNDAILVANPLNPRYEEQLAALGRLRKEGIAE